MGLMEEVQMEQISCSQEQPSGNEVGREKTSLRMCGTFDEGNWAV
jgi:hypothetical protein